jgi:hypothetical protein
MSDALRLHILDKLVEGIPEDCLLENVERSGFNTEEIVDAFSTLHRIKRDADKRQAVSREHSHWMAGVYRRLQKGGRTVSAVRNIDDLTFFRDYYSQNRPVLIQDFAALGGTPFRWSFETIKQTYSDVELEVTRWRHDSTKGDKPVAYIENVRLDDLIDEMQSAETRSLYLTSRNEAAQTPFGRVLDGFSPLPHIVNASELRLTSKLWMGPTGAISPLHYDTSNVMIVQLLGVKRVVLVAPHERCFLYEDEPAKISRVAVETPNLDKFPLYKFANPKEVTVKAGSALFVPVGWWHFVESVTPNLSLSTMDFHKSNYKWPRLVGPTSQR